MWAFPLIGEPRLVDVTQQGTQIVAIRAADRLTWVQVTTRTLGSTVITPGEVTSPDTTRGSWKFYESVAREAVPLWRRGRFGISTGVEVRPYLVSPQFRSCQDAVPRAARVGVRTPGGAGFEVRPARSPAERLGDGADRWQSRPPSVSGRQLAVVALGRRTRQPDGSGEQGLDWVRRWYRDLAESAD